MNWWKRRSLAERVAQLERRMEDMEASQGATQAQVDTDTTAIAKIGTDLAASVATVQAELNSLQAQVAAQPGVSLDLSKLEAAIAAVDSQAQAVASLAPQAPAPAPTPPAGG